mgnify:FL=1
MANYCFSGHESFACKSLWLKKGYDFVVQKRDFNAPDAVIHLGVGKNMVSSIRYWLKVCDIYDDGKITPLGYYLLDDQNGKDPYLEDLATLWLLHFNLVFNGQASIYKIFFCEFQRERARFTKEQFTNHIKYKLVGEGLKTAFNENTVKKDIDVLIHNYALPRKPQSNEDFSALFIDLDLLRINDDGKEYYFNTEGKRKVPTQIFLYALTKLKEKEGDNTLPYDDIRHYVGMTFCMTDAEIIEMLKQLASQYSSLLSYSDEAGIRQIQFIKDIASETILNDYYEASI